MKIDPASHPEFVRGAFRMEPSEQGLRLLRMSPELDELYRGNEAWKTRANCPAGVRIVFGTDSRRVRFILRYGCEARSIYTADLTIDGEKRISCAPPQRMEEFHFSTELPPGGPHEIELALPNMVECTLANLEVEDGCALYAVLEPEKRLLFLGDSITQGMTVSSPSRSYADLFAKLHNADYVNLAVGGAVMCGRAGELALDYEWDAAFVAYGVNDYTQNRPLETFRAETRSMLAALTTRSGAKICLLTPIPWLGDPGNNSNGDTLEGFRAALAEAAAEFPGISLIDGRKLVPADPAFFIDHLHPNDAGAEQLAINLERAIGGNIDS